MDDVVNNEVVFDGKEKDKIMQRFSRASGQLDAVKRMIDEGKPLNQVLVQLQAVISAIQSIKVEIVQEQVRQNILEEIKKAFQIMK
ncbi:MAG TPA: metal-sensitive transcriptional regulator [Flavobacterium alvei]|nr:metal-sensitive transcriptional regulator [Candidatus Dojkabacteria bacterium]HQF36101.1 metal-sensitive transcriptional regulator [Candidatus Dojkabacteria bacterium]HQK40493.1 metal-sensitive transcriptional regulator [Flavobacterium alvei]